MAKSKFKTVDEKLVVWLAGKMANRIAFHGPIHGEWKSHCELYDVASARVHRCVMENQEARMGKKAEPPGSRSIRQATSSFAGTNCAIEATTRVGANG